MRTLSILCFSWIVALQVSAQLGPAEVLVYGADQFSMSESKIMDVDGDGLLDLAVNVRGRVNPPGGLAPGPQSYLGYFKNLGDGEFARLFVFDEFNHNLHGIWGELIADLDGDGTSEYLTYGQSTSSTNYATKVYWTRPHLGESWAQGQQLIFPDLDGFSVLDLSAEDIEGDGDLDLLFVNENTIWWFENVGDLQFAPAATLYEATGEIEEKVYADIDHDGDLDVLISERISQDKLILLENQDGVFIPSILQEGQNYYRKLHLAEINGDSRMDILYTPAYSGGGPPRLLLSNGSNYSAPQPLTGISGTGGYIVTVFDYNSDGIDELVISSSQSPDVLYETSAGGALVSPLFSLEPPFLGVFLGGDFSFRHADINGDGTVEIFRASGRNLWIFDPVGATLPEPPRRVGVRTDGYVVPFDFNQDGILDFAAEQDISSDYGIAYGIGGGIYRPLEIIAPDVVNYGVELQDINVDGWMDIIILSGNPTFNWGTTHFLINNGGNGFLPPDEIIGESRLFERSFSDFNQDGLPDALYFDGALKLATGNGTSIVPTDVILTTDTPESYFVRFFNDDHLPDVLYTVGQELFWVRNEGNGSFTEMGLLFTSSHSILAVEDVNEDGYQDILVNQVSLPDLNVGIALGGPPPYTYQIESTELSYTQVEGDDPVLLTGQFNDDRKPDLFLTGRNGGNTEDWMAYSQTETDFDEINFSTFGKYDLTRWDFGATTPRAIDYDRDGDDDLMGFRPDGIQNCYLRENVHEPNRGVLLTRVYNDYNENGLREPNEPVINVGHLIVQPWLPSSTTMRLDNVWRMEAAAGDYELTLDKNDYFEFTTDSIFDYVATNGQPEYHNIGLKIADTLAQVSVQLHSGLTRCDRTVPFVLNYGSEGTLPIDGELSFIFDPLTTLVSAPGAPIAQTDTSLTWLIDALPFDSAGQFVIYLQMPDFTAIDTMLQFSAHFNTSSGAGDAATDFYQATLLCAYDPNDKQVWPNYPGDYPDYVQFGDTLEYMIRFQNTGNDTAFQVLLVDQLDDRLDRQRFAPVAASHPYTFSLDGTGRLTVRFDNILLPDSTTNYTGSMGFFTFRVPLRPDLSSNGPIFNQAEIYFDTNPAIYTNTTLSYPVEYLPLELDIDVSTCNDGSGATLSVVDFAPGIFNFLWNDGGTGRIRDSLASGNYELTVSDLNGKILSVATALVDVPAPLQVDVDMMPSLPGQFTGRLIMNVSGGVAPYTYAWEEYPTINSHILNGVGPGIYNFTVIDANGCSQTVEAVVETIVDVERVNLQKVTAFPNPTSSFLELQFAANLRLQKIELRDLTGRNVWQKIGGQTRIDLSGLPPGTYILIADFGDDFGMVEVMIK